MLKDVRLPIPQGQEQGTALRGGLGLWTGQGELASPSVMNLQLVPQGGEEEDACGVPKSPWEAWAQPCTRLPPPRPQGPVGATSASCGFK